MEQRLGFDPKCGAWDGNLYLINPNLCSGYDDKDFYFLTCAWCGQEDSWRFQAGSPFNWVNWGDRHAKYDAELGRAIPVYPLPAWVCDNCESFLRKYAKEFDSYGSYGAYLRSFQWERVKYRALYRAGHKCQLCSNRERLDVHHNTYENIGREKPEDVLVLCHNCHAKHHNKLPR